MARLNNNLAKYVKWNDAQWFKNVGKNQFFKFIWKILIQWNLRYNTIYTRYAKFKWNLKYTIYIFAIKIICSKNSKYFLESKHKI